MEKAATKQSTVDKTTAEYFRHEAVGAACIAAFTLIAAVLVFTGVASADEHHEQIAEKVAMIIWVMCGFAMSGLFIYELGQFVNNNMKHREAISPHGYQPLSPPSPEHGTNDSL